MNNNRQIIHTALPSDTTPMLIVVDKDIVDGFAKLLGHYQKALKEAIDSQKALLQKIENDQLLTEEQAQVYLSRDANTLRYYRNLGLDYYKKGQDRWYSKADIDAWLESGKVNRHKR